MSVSVLVWAMVGIATWRFAVLVRDKFFGGIIGASLAAVAGALIALALTYAYGAHRERKAEG